MVIIITSEGEIEQSRGICSHVGRSIGLIVRWITRTHTRSGESLEDSRLNACHFANVVDAGREAVEINVSLLYLFVPCDGWNGETPPPSSDGIPGSAYSRYTPTTMAV